VKRKKQTKRKKWFYLKWGIIILVIVVVGLSLYKGITDYFDDFFYRIAYENYIYEYSDKYGIDPYLVMAVIKVESNFKTDAISPKGAIGLMQIMPETGKWLAKINKFDNYSDEALMEAETNIMYGCSYLNWLNKQFDGDRTKVLAGYNGGIGNVKEWLNDQQYSRDGISLDNIPFPETKNYVKKVEHYYDIYKKRYGKGKISYTFS
jgi:soluble lytic murein transglycosylase